MAGIGGFQVIKKLDWKKILKKVLTPTLRDTVFSEVEKSWTI